MRSSNYTVIGALALGAVGVASSASAQEDRHELTIAAGAAVLPSYEGSDDYKIIPGAALRGRVADFPFFTRGTHLYVDLVRNSDEGLDIELGPIAGVRLSRTGKIRDDQVKALGELDTAWEAGGWAGIAKTGVLTSDYDNLSFRTSYVADVGNTHKSYVITPAVEYAMPLSQSTLLGFSVSADYVGKGYGRYYFNVSPAGSLASGLAAYSGAAKAGFASVNFGLLAAQSLSGDVRKGWAVFAAGGYGRLLGRYARSPIVRDAGSRDQWRGGIGVSYTF